MLFSVESTNMSQATQRSEFTYSDFPRSVNLGCGFDLRENYLNVDLNDFHGADLVSDVTRLDMLPSEYYEQAVANDVLEHIPRAKCVPALKEWNRILILDGALFLQVPNVIGLTKLLEEPSNQSFDAQDRLLQCLFGTQGYTGDFHYNGFTEITIRALLASAGFSVTKLEERDVWLFDIEARKRLHCPRDAWMDVESDEEFLEYAYVHILGRDSDDAGFQHFLGMIRKGCERETVVEILRTSQEARSQRVK